MNNFVYHAPTKVIFGVGAENKVGKELAEANFKKVLVLYGKGSVKASGLLDRVIKSLKDSGIEYVEMGGVEANPKVSFVREAIKVAQKNDVELVLAVGGGSVIDAAKAVGLALSHNIDPWEMIEKRIHPTKRVPTAAVLTIASAGSEMSHSCVLTDEDSKLKRSVNSDYLRPYFAFENPEYTIGVDKYQTACGIVDTMMHTLERYFTTDINSDLTDSIAEALLISVKNAGKKVMANPNDYDSRATLMWASSLSHNGLTGVGKSHYFPVHKLEHDISGLYDVAHGAGMAVVFPAWAKYVYKYDVNRFARFANKVWKVELDLNNLKWTAKEGIKAMKNYFKEIGMPTTMGELGVKRADYATLAKMTTSGGTREVRSYIPLGEKEIIDIFNIATE
ncbi:MAG: iron-containing alcohol dehydrogenase [Sphaerochaetaceae bacterium]|jgi:alcohol dehydrogenase YqhD (iron-dependent ADH family)